MRSHQPVQVLLLEVRQEHVLSGAPQLRIGDHGVQLVIDGDAQRIEVRGPHTHEPPIHHARLRVHHHPPPLPDSHAIVQQPPVDEVGEPAHPRMVVLARHQDTNVDAVERCSSERFELRV